MKKEYDGIPVREFLLPILALIFFVGCLIFVFATSCSRCNLAVYDKPVFKDCVEGTETIPEMLKEHLESDVPKG